MQSTVERLIRESLGEGAAVEGLQKLHGDASYRTYFRARLTDGRSIIVMQMPPGKSSVSEEITNFAGTPGELPFVNVQRYLAQLGLPVPQIYTYSGADRLMLVEDLGDGLMAHQVEAAPEAERLAWYGRALELLLRLQRETRAHPSKECVASLRSFDARLLNWEFDHFREYGIEARTGEPMPPADRERFEAETRAIAAEIERMPYGFTHRDFQSRNLLIRDGRFYLIDFQDALQGPRAYDLVALTRDSYVKLADATVGSLVQRYAEEIGVNAAAVRREYDLVTVQRKLKDAGRFVFIDRVKGNPNFLQYIPASLGYVRDAMARLPECGRLAELLRRYVPEWQ